MALDHLPLVKIPAVIAGFFYGCKNSKKFLKIAEDLANFPLTAIKKKRKETWLTPSYFKILHHARNIS